LDAYEEYARVPQEYEDDFAYAMAEGVHFGVGERASDEVEGEVKVGEREECE
jgi:hypothetical protein